MVSINLSLSESLEHFIDERVAETGMQSREQYVEQLLRAERKRLAKEKLDELLLAGLDSEPIEVTDSEAFWEDMKLEAIERYRKKHGENGAS